MKTDCTKKSGAAESSLDISADEFCAMSRRNFLVMGAAATAGVYLAGSEAVARQSGRTDKSPGNTVANSLSLLKDVDIYFPGDERYGSFLEGLFSREAGQKKPSAIVCPKKHEDIMRFVEIAVHDKLKFTVCGGGLSSLSVQTDMICLALNVFYNKVEVLDRDGCTIVKACGGAKVGDIVAILKNHGRHIPVGVSPMPGLGLVMRGGIGHLSRSEGLTCDHISQVNFVTACGDNFLLDANCARQYLWNAVRGAAPRFGIVSEVYLDTVPGTKVTVSRLTADTGMLNGWMENADKLQDSVSASFVLGSDSVKHMNPVFYGYLVHQGSNENALAELSSAQKNMTGDAKLSWLEEAHVVDYAQMPPFDVPLRDSGELGGEMIPVVKSYLVKNRVVKRMGEVLLNAIRTAPNQFCRIDFQHMGGEVRRIKNGSVFSGRDADWNVVVTGFYYAHSLPDEVEKTTAWVKNIMHRINAAIVGVYSVEIKKDTPETKHELEMAFRNKLSLLHRLAAKYDPYNLLSHYPL
ncbi:FAD-binding oxidoreductase [Methylococcus geothermalis]|uniref:FAD-binding protein n=1 Tax=Methylococcus geothermalis TaxID=2681310 RepID=A0A858QA32_9GAMM|nr:FAD-binding protein [Methylococcus geothermalis]QJD30792.1 FAD-binding protein [Methylococcus geothermalis]